METIVCQATEINSAEFAARSDETTDSIATLSSTDMSFVGGGLIAVAFA